jgi:SPP1 gp7 family putative phage head morphogenesis protein
MPLSPMIRRHLEELLRLENRAVARLVEPYRQAQAELTQRLLLLEAQGSGDTFGATRLALMRQQIDAVLTALEATQGDNLRQAVREAVERGATQGRDEIADLEARLGDSRVAELITAIQPIVPAEAAAAIADAPSLLISKFRGEVQTVVSTALAQAVIQGEGTAQAARRLQRAMGGERWKAERIARTEINHAMNVGHHSVIDQVAMEFPEMGLKKQWSAHLDLRTSRRCRGLHLKVAETGQLFTALDGWKGLYPPAHPNCRSRVVPYSERWEATSRQQIASEAVGTAKNPRRKAEPTVGDAVSAARSNRVRDPRPLRPALPVAPVAPPRPAAQAGAPVAEPWALALQTKLQGVDRNTVTEAQVRVFGAQVRAELERRMPEVEAKYSKRRFDVHRKIDAGTITREEGAKLRHEAMRQQHTDRLELVKSVIAQVRPLGRQAMQTAPRTEQAVMPAFQRAFECYPDEWQTRSNQAAPMRAGLTSRGRYNPNTSVIKTSGANEVERLSTCIHELGHRMEAVVPNLSRLEREWYERRTQGEALEWLGPGHRRTELTRKDQFTHTYIGKDYGGEFYEVFTMGVECVFLGQHGIDNDPDLIDFVLGTLVTL